MIRTTSILALTLVATLGLAPVGPQDQKKLAVGDATPTLDGLDFVQGSIEDMSASGTKVLVVEFWATWCGPCLKSIPHINEMYESYKDQGLVVVGVSDEKRSKVEPFVKKRGSEMSYPVAIDTEKKVNEAFMVASGQKGIPCAFVTTVQAGQTAGKVVYIGHPMAPEFETAVRLSLTGRYDPVLTKKAQPLLDAARRAIGTKNYKDGYKRFDEVIALDPAIFAPIAIEKYDVMLNVEGNEAGAKAYAAELLKGLVALGDAAALRDLAVALSSDPANKSYDYDLAMQAAEAMLKIAGKNDPTALATVAGVEYARGEFAKAVDSQKKAYRIASPSRKAAFKATLDAYELALKKGVKVKVPETAQVPVGTPKGPVETVPAKP